ncbi:MAG TPA: hypothetical protein VD789_13465 [Thermomicrobiales bacterium]|nr:hypothetical protein [Thermomicrobiales bacterium]
MIEFHVIGELRDDPGHLLVIDGDGQCYDFDVALDEIFPIEMDERWSVDVVESPVLVVEAPVERIAS